MKENKYITYKMYNDGSKKNPQKETYFYKHTLILYSKGFQYNILSMLIMYSDHIDPIVSVVLLHIH